MGLRFLHVSDIHLLDLSGARPWHYLGKRITGRVNLWLKRSKQHDGKLFDRIAELVPRLGVERVVVTGDLTNLSLPSEFEHVRRKLDALAVPVTVIPGNHDAYTRGSARAKLFERHLGHLMEGEHEGGEDYPFVQRFTDVALVGVSTAVPSPPLFAIGRVGPDQLARLRVVLERLRDDGLRRVVLIHHPPVAGVSKPRHELLDLDAFDRVIAELGAELVLHGHEHRRVESTLPGPDGDVPVHGIGSGTSISARPGREGAFAVYDVTKDGIDREVHVWNGMAFEPRAG
jgi:3',5'-cyclic AMP phosphodiesterase CpdA